MATRTITHWTDDVDGSEADETVRFEVDGVAYEIDLNTGHAEQLREALSVYVVKGRRVHRPVNRHRRGA